MRHDAAANDCNCLLPQKPKQPQFHLSQVFILRVAKNEEREREIAQHKEATKKSKEKLLQQGVCKCGGRGAHMENEPKQICFPAPALRRSCCCCWT